MNSPSSLEAAPQSIERRRFVLLFHELPAHSDRASHWDFMIESGPSLRTWALPVEISNENPANSDTDGLALALPDHRLAYLDYEGPVSGDRGTVRRVAMGVHSLQVDGAANRSSESNEQQSASPDGQMVELMIELVGHSSDGRPLAGCLKISPPDERQKCHWSWHPQVTSKTECVDSQAK